MRKLTVNEYDWQMMALTGTPHIQSRHNAALARLKAAMQPLV